MLRFKEFYFIRAVCLTIFQRVPSRQDLKAVFRPGSLDSIQNEKQYTNTDVFVKVELLQARDTFVSTSKGLLF